MPDIEMQQYKETIQKGSKSFAMASLFFSQKQKEAAWKLYSWCRYCDDEIDEVPIEQAQNRLLFLKEQTQNLLSSTPSNIAFKGLKEVVQEYKIPLHYPLDLLRGMEMDVAGDKYATLEDLEEYCYCVASTVGLMMCHIMGVRHDAALNNAVALGKAMQLTNICRDLVEDFQRGRCYLPTDWLFPFVSFEDPNLLSPQYRKQLIEVQERLLKRADELYQEGYAGLQFLSLRSAWAVLIAARVYSYIGEKIRKDTYRGFTKRIFVGLPKKILIVLSTLRDLVPLVLQSRVRQKSVRIPKKVWSVK